MNRRGFLGSSLASLAALALHRSFHDVGPEPELGVADSNDALAGDEHVGKALTETIRKCNDHRISFTWGCEMIKEYVDGMRVPPGTLKARFGICIIPPGEEGTIVVWMDPGGGSG